MNKVNRLRFTPSVRASATRQSDRNTPTFVILTELLSAHALMPMRTFS